MQDHPQAITLDIRPLLSQGIEPFGAIMEARQQLSIGQPLILRAPFEPLPLYEIFKSEGFSVQSTQHGPENWEIHFNPGAGSDQLSNEIDARGKGDSHNIQKSLEAIQCLGRGEKFILHTDAKPADFLDRIDKMTTDYDSEKVDNGHWQTILWRIGG